MKKIMKKTSLLLAAALLATAGMVSCTCGSKCDSKCCTECGEKCACGEKCECGDECKCEDTCNSNTAAIIENIMTRTSVRAYTDEPVGKDTIESLVRAGLAAPTAVNAQPWHIVAVSNRALLDSLGATNPNKRMFEQAPLAIIVCGDMSKTLEGIGREFWIQDCSAATENILLAAHAYGLGAVWTAAYPVQERFESIQKVLNLKNNLIPLCAIIIGHPAENPEPKDKWKEENVTFME